MRKYKTYSVSSATPGASVLEAAAANLYASSPSAPAWSGLDPVGASTIAASIPIWTVTNRTTGATGVSGTSYPTFTAPANDDAVAIPADVIMETSLYWPGPTHFDPVNREWWAMLGVTNQQPSVSGNTVVRYKLDAEANAARGIEAADRFRTWGGVGIHTSGDPAQSDGLWRPLSQAHNFGAAAFNATSRKLYRVLNCVPATARSVSWNSSVDGRTYDPAYDYIGWFDVDALTVGVFPFPSWSPSDFAVPFYPSMGAITNRGSQGTIYVVDWNRGNNLRARYYDVAAATWGPSYLVGPSVSEACGYGVWTHNNVIYVTSAALGTGLPQMHSLTWNGSAHVYTALAAPPILMDNAYGPDQSIIVGLGAYLYAFCKNGNVYRYDITNNNWGGGAVYDTIENPITTPSTTQGYVGEFVAAAIDSIANPVIFCIFGEGTNRTRLWKP